MAYYSTESKKIINELRREMEAGHVPARVRSYSEVCDYMDQDRLLTDVAGMDVGATEEARLNGISYEVTRWLQGKSRKSMAI